MTLEQQVTSLEISKRLKELGVKQDGLYWWRGRLLAEGHVSDKSKVCSAFTVAELGEMLKDKHTLPVYDGQTNVWFGYHKERPSFGAGDYINAETEANARGKMLIYLLENKLISVED